MPPPVAGGGFPGTSVTREWQMNSKATALLPVEQILPSIFIVRGQLVLLGCDLATFYGVTTKAVRLSVEETGALVSQFVPLNVLHDGPRYAFTEHGALAAAMVVKSPQAIEMGAQVVLAFIQMRGQMFHALASQKDLELSVQQLEARSESHDLIIGIMETVCGYVKSWEGLPLTDEQGADLRRRLDEYEKNRDASGFRKE
jgi:hypothetical protein